MFIFFTLYNLKWLLESQNLFSWIFNAVSSKKKKDPRVSIYNHFNYRTVEFFPPAESLLVNLNFKRAAGRMRGCHFVYTVRQCLDLHNLVERGALRWSFVCGNFDFSFVTFR